MKSENYELRITNYGLIASAHRAIRLESAQ